MTIERGMFRPLVVLSVLILVAGAWAAGEAFDRSVLHHQWSTESGCDIPGSVIPWCSAEKRAGSAQLAALTRQAAIECARVTVSLIVALWTTFYTVRWIVRGFQRPKGNRA
jgi:hypothetical protein